MISNYLDSNDFAHIRMMLREEAETDNGYAISVIRKLDETEKYILCPTDNKKDNLAEEMISRKEDLRQTADELADLLQQIVTGAIHNNGTEEWAAGYVARARTHVRYLLDLIDECEETKIHQIKL